MPENFYWRGGHLAKINIDDIEPSLENAFEFFPPVKYGPVWQKDPKTGNWVVPTYTLGWDVIEWCYDNLLGFDGGEHLEFTPEQERWLLWFYAVDSDGDRMWRKGMFQRMKGWGKDPMSAAICLAELLGPVYFDRFEDDPVLGRVAVGIPHPDAWVQLAATTEAQNRNTMLAIPPLLPKRTIQKYGLDVMSTRINVKGKLHRRLETISSNYQSAEGNRPTFVLMNESHHWTDGNHGTHMYEVLDRNVDKVRGAWLMITNAYQPGEDSAAERQRNSIIAFLEGRADDPGILYDSLEAHPEAPLTKAWAAYIVRQVCGDSFWVPAEDLAKGIANTAIEPSRYRRFYYNQTVADSDALYGELDLDRIMRPSEELSSGDEIVLGFDGGRTDDATALVAMRLRDRTFFLLGLWQKPDRPGMDDWQVNKQAVNSVVHSAFKAFRVKAFFADVHMWESDIDAWADAYRETLLIKADPRHAVAYDMRYHLKQTTMYHERLVQSVYDSSDMEERGEVGLHIGGGNGALIRRHALNARKRSNPFGISFAKVTRESTLKVDAYAAMLLAFIAERELVERGPAEKPVKNKTLYGW